MPATIIRVVEGTADLKCFRGKGGNNWIAVSDSLKLTVQSETFNDLMEDVGLTIEAILRDLLRSNELERFLQDRGWRIAGPIPNPQADVRFDVPFYQVIGPHGSPTELHQ